MLILILIAMFMASAVWASLNDNDEGIFFAGAIISIFVLGITAIISGTYQPDIDRSEIVSLQDNTQTGGSFFLGIGTIEGNPAYSYYKVVGDNQFKQRLLVEDQYTDVSVIQDVKEGESAYVETIGEHKDAGCSWLACSFGDTQVDKIQFHVPEGTIKQNFVLDAQ